MSETPVKNASPAPSIGAGSGAASQKVRANRPSRLLGWALGLGALLLLVSAPAARALRIAAAADLEPVLPPILKEFQQHTGTKAEVVYASSAVLASQILNGAPFDLFLSADFSFPEKVIAGGRAVEPRPLAYARGTLVLWARKDAPILDRGPITLQLLRDPRLGKVAIANPHNAPYGRAAVAAIQSLGLTATLKPRLVVAENIAQAAQFVESGNAEAGFLSLTSAVTPELSQAGTFVRLPADSYPPILQGAVEIKGAAGRSAAQKFLDFLRTPAVRKQLLRSGLRAP